MSRLIRIRPVKLHMSQAVADYLEFKRAQGLAESTLKDYTQRLAHFMRRFALAMLEEESLRRAIVSFLSDKMAPATYNLRLVTLHGFCKWCVGEGLLARDLTTGFKKRVAQGRVVQIDNDVLAGLLKRPDQTTFSGLRDYALLLLSLDTGIRPGEALKLQPFDFDALALNVTIPAAYAKTRRQRVVPITQITASVLRRLIAVRHPKWSADAPLFCNQDGGPLRIRSWEDRLDDYSRELGVKITPYALRHSFALSFVRNGDAAFALQKMMGHSDMNMTRVYVNLTSEDLTLAHSAASPLNTLLPKTARLRKKARF